MVVIPISFFSCASGNSNEKVTTRTIDSQTTPPPVAAYDSTLSKGYVIDTIICKDDKSQTYSLYLPSYYSQAKQFPCIYFYDAHARGSIPVRMYKELAEKYGFVLIGSNVSKNGMAWPATNDIVKALMQDSRARINIDPKRIYTSGFSGGSRVASSVAIFNGGIAGVIGCSAGFPKVEQGIQNKFDYFGLVGDYDFNLTEMEQLDKTLQQNGFTHQLLTFKGIHGWAPVADMETAILWMQVNAMKEDLQTKNDTLIPALKNNINKRITVANRAHDLVTVTQLLDGIARVLNGLANVSAYKKQLADMISSTSYKQATQLQQQLQQREASLQQELTQQFPTQNEQWWVNKLAELNKNIHITKTLQEANMNRRLLSYIGFISYMYTDHALKSSDLSNTENYLKIFKLADPKNPDVCYLKAIYYVKKGDNNVAISALADAASLGYNDLAQLQSEPIFQDLRNEVGFKKVIDKVKNNYMK